MSKVSGAYPSLSRGVNQQPFEARLDGQHGEQVNMWSDPVNGLARRRGTVLQSCYTDNPNGPSYHQLADWEKEETRNYFASYRTVPYTTDGLELIVHYPTAPMPVWMRTTSGPSGGIKVTRKIQGPATLAPGADVEDVGLGAIGSAGYATTMAAVYKGFSAAAQVGRYMLFYPNSTPFTVPAEAGYWDSLPNGAVSMEIIQGIPNRTYTVTAMVDGVPFSWTYTTPSSAYSGVLDTTDILTSDPDYQKKVNDRVNAYNSAVTAWVTTAAQQTRPSYIAAQLFEAMNPVMTVIGAVLYNSADHGGLLAFVTNGRAYRFAVSDGGSNDNFRLTERTVTSASQLTSRHLNGKVVKVEPERGGGAFYVKAVTDGGVGWARVRWEETASTSAGAVTNPFIIMACRNPQVGGRPRLGLSSASPTGLTHLAGIIADSTVLTLPIFGNRLVGDPESSPSPSFYNKQVSWIGMFQDRLCIAAGNVINMSEVGNYFNFWRTQTLTVPDKDPVEIYALGSETDTIRHSVIFDRSLLLFGDNQQYSIDGRNPVTPASSAIIQSSAIEDTTDCPPIAGRSLVFFGKRREGSAEVFQMEVGDVTDTSNFTGLGLQLSDYLTGRPAQLLYVSSPSTLFVRTSEAPHSLYVFRFIDQGRQRLLDSWSRFDYHPAFGIIYGMFYHEDAVYLRVAREAWVDADNVVWTGGNDAYGFDVLERQSMLPQVSGLPYLDSARPVAAVWESAEEGTDWFRKRYPFLASAFSRDKIFGVSGGGQPSPKYQYWLYGVTPNPSTPTEFNAAFTDIPSRDQNYCVTGISFDSYVELTSPMRKARDGQPIMQGRLTVGKLDVYYKDSGGFVGTVTSRYGIADQYNNFDWSAQDTDYGTVTALRFNGRVLGQAANMVGVIPVASGSSSVFVGRDSREYVCKISSRNWMPLSITRVTWTGQWFMNHSFV